MVEKKRSLETGAEVKPEASIFGRLEARDLGYSGGNSLLRGMVFLF